MTLKSTKRSAACKSLLTGASVLAATAAMLSASPAAAQDEGVDEDEAIVVTGTRLVRQDFEAISPVTTVSSEQLELTATLTTDSLLNELPQIVPGNTRTSNNAGGFDFATVDLRGLGPQRTLVLVNGERVPVSSTLGGVDLNTIPASLISRIEVVTGGASAVYGSDALAGVVNFVLKDDYEGAEINLTYGSELETGNVAEFEINGLVGGNFANGRGNLTAYASYFNREGVLQSEYDFSRVSGAVCYDFTRGEGGSSPSGGNQAYFICDNIAEAQANGFFPSISGGSATAPWGVINNNPNFDTNGDGIPDVGTGNPFGNPTAYNCQGGPAGPDMSDDGICNNSEGNGTPGSAGDALLAAVGGFVEPLFAAAPAGFGAGNYDTNCDGVPNAAGFNGNANISFNVSGAVSTANSGGPGNLCSIPDRSRGSSRYNFAPDNFLIIPAERINLTTSGHYEINDSVRLNIMFNYSNARSEVQLAPTPATNLTVTMTPATIALISANHPDLLAALASRPNDLAPFVINRRTNEVGTRNAFFENNSVYFMSGLEGSLGENWDWNVSASYGQVSFNTRAINSVNLTALRQGLAGCQNPDGSPITGMLPGCVPLDVYGEGTLDQAMVDFIRVDTYNDTIIEESRVQGFVRGDLFELPAGPVASVFGFEYRDSYAGSFNDNEQRTGNIAGFNAVQDQEGQIDVYEMYAEFAVPLVSEAPFAHYLGLEAGYRRSNYSSVGDVDSYKIGGEWAPIEWLRFRGILNEATRAPSVFELFQGGDQGFPSFTDPCNGAAPVATCIGAPAPANVPGGAYPFNQNNAQVQAFAFGNPNLGAETAETSTYGLVFTPDWFPLGDIRVSADYYDIEITDVIAPLGAQFFINDCYVNGNVAGGCGRIVRDQTTGQIVSVNVTVSNQGALATQGYDIQAEWSVPVGPGQLTVNELYSILDDISFNGASFAGTTSAGIGGAFPDYKSVLSVTYNVGDFTFFGRWSYVPTVVSAVFALTDDGQPGQGDDGFFDPGCATASPPGCFAVPNFVDNPTESPAASYIDASIRWNVSDSFTLTANIDNVLDELAPQTADGFFSQANTDPQVYRMQGRTFAISGRYRF